MDRRAERASRIEGARFGAVRLREGYDMSQVDAFLTELARAARAGEDLAEPIRRVQLTPVRLREGYDMGQVDDFLADLTRGDDTDPTRPTRPRPASAAPSGAVADPGVVVETRRLWQRLRGR